MTTMIPNRLRSKRRRRLMSSTTTATAVAVSILLAAVPESLTLAPHVSSSRTRARLQLSDMNGSNRLGPAMFTSPPQSGTLGNLFNRFGGGSTFSGPSTQFDDDDNHAHHRGPLGFQGDLAGESDTALHATAFRMSTQQSRTLSSSFSGTSPIKNQVAARLLRNQRQQSSGGSSTSMPSWFPWIPRSMHQIDELDPAALREVCAQRNLSQDGTTVKLKQRLWTWACQSNERNKAARAVGGRMSIGEAFVSPKLLQQQQSSKNDVIDVPDSLQAWARKNEERLLNRRKEIQENRNKPKQVKKRQALHAAVGQDYLDILQRLFDAPPAEFSNKQVQQLFRASTQAYRASDLEAAKQILTKLSDAAPTDPRVVKRLAQMSFKEGNLKEARKILDQGLVHIPTSASLYLGLAKIAQRVKAPARARTYLTKAMEVDPGNAQVHYALGLLEHEQGRVAIAMKILKRGIDYAPNNHDLHHALGYIYRGAGMLDMAKHCFAKALECAPKSRKSRAFMALAYIAYENGHVDACRSWLKRGAQHGSTDQGIWVAWARMEEAEGNIDAARQVIYKALQQHEQSKLETDQYHQSKWKAKRDDSLHLVRSKAAEPSSNKKKRKSRHQDTDFMSVYINWGRLERIHGTADNVDEVYSRATEIYQGNWKFYDVWARYHQRNGNVDRARELYQKAVEWAQHKHARPHRRLAELIMSLGNYQEAQAILYQGAKKVSSISDGGLLYQSGMAELYHTWAICEWHLGNLERAEVLFDHALRMNKPGEHGARLRASILYSIARLEYNRGELLLAQHCIGLCLKEDRLAGGNARVWELWHRVATDMGNEGLAQECQVQLTKCREKKTPKSSAMRRLLASKTPDKDELAQYVSSVIRKEPWSHKLGKQHQRFNGGVALPELGLTDDRVVTDEEEEDDDEDEEETELLGLPTEQIGIW